MAAEEMLIVKKSYEFSKWLLQHTGKFPKSYRFSVAVRIESTILDFTELVAVANMHTNRLLLLRQADENLTRLRLLICLSHDMQFLNLKSYEYGSRQIAELGKMLGGWMKKTA
ncbi:MAG: diversity-generating retroelement protein Avd [Chlorobiales bacterium]|nr:diversity-generating retroelement protein Avd [Chlorobiales bacterium]